MGQPTEPIELSGIGPANAPAPVAGQPPVQDPTSLEPGVERVLADPQFAGQVAHEPFITPQCGSDRLWGLAVAWGIPQQEAAHDVFVELPRPFRWTEALCVQMIGDRAA
jgi:hypothetical protein